MTRGEMWWFEEPNGRRPGCILSREEAVPVLASVVVVPATTTVRGIPSEVKLDRDDGMPRPCVLSFDNVTTIPKALLIERITRLSPARMHEVCTALRIATDC